MPTVFHGVISLGKEIIINFIYDLILLLLFHEEFFLIEKERHIECGFCVKKNNTQRENEETEDI